MSITSTEATSATQRATWTHEATEGTYTAAVTLASSLGVDEFGKSAWVWELGFLPREGVGFHYTGSDADVIRTHDMDPLDVLGTLAVFVSAWDEAMSYGRGAPDSENRDLFPAACEPFLGAAEEFSYECGRD